MGDESMGFGVPPCHRALGWGVLANGVSPRLGAEILESSNSCSPYYKRGSPAGR